MRMIYRMGRMMLIVAAAVAVSAGTAAAQTTGTFTDSRDGQAYKTVTIGAQTWMARNLNYRTEKRSCCYEKSDDYCKKYGRLYDWKTAITVCPAGWKLPDTADWRLLITAAGGKETAGKILKSKTGWFLNNNKVVSGNGTDDYGFSALPGGTRGLDGGFTHAGYYGFWWTATKSADGYAYYRGMHNHDDFVNEDDYEDTYGRSVRCIKE
jgi:uncharacterized protein (TIGR02145 family)